MPEIVAAVLAATAEVLIVKVALVEPAAIVMLTGTRATPVLLLCNVTRAPPDGAVRVKVAVPVEFEPPVNDVGFSVMDESDAGGVTVRAAVRLTPSVAVIVAELSLKTGLVVTANVAVVLPADTVTELGTWASDVLSLVSATTIPPVGAAPVIVTVAVEFVPPTTEVGFKDNVEAVGAFTLRTAPFVTPYVPNMLTEVLEATGLEVTVNVAVVRPAETITLVGTRAAA